MDRIIEWADQFYQKAVQSVENAWNVATEEYNVKMRDAVFQALSNAVGTYYAGGATEWSEGRFASILEMTDFIANIGEFKVNIESVEANAMMAYHGWANSWLQAEGAYDLMWIGGQHGDNVGYVGSVTSPNSIYMQRAQEYHDNYLDEILNNFKVNALAGLA